MMRVSDIFSVSNCVFSKMKYTFPIEKTVLDTGFVVDYSERWLSPIVALYTSNGTMTDDNMAKLANLIETIYKDRWDRIKSTLSLDYDVLNPKETKENTITDSTAGYDSKVYGYDSETGVNDESNTTTGKTTQQKTTTGRGGYLPQQLINAELEVRKNSFYRIVLSDVADVLTLKVY